MLRIQLDYGRITAAQTGYREQGTRAAMEAAMGVMGFRQAFEHLVRRFGDRQSAAVAGGKDYLETGTQDELLTKVLGGGSHGWPTRAAAALHGLVLPVDPVLPEVPCRAGGADLRALDAESYLTTLNDGPPAAREFGKITALALYLHPLKTLKILWIGLDSDVGGARGRLQAETADWTDWSGLCGDYADWLKARCGTGMRLLT